MTTAVSGHPQVTISSDVRSEIRKGALKRLVQVSLFDSAELLTTVLVGMIHAINAIAIQILTGLKMTAALIAPDFMFLVLNR